MRYFVTLCLLMLLSGFSVGTPLLGVPHAEAAEETEAIQYTCGMHPMVISDEPGLCPICHMELTPLHGHDDGDSDYRVIEVDQVTRQRMGVRTALAQLRTLRRSIRTVGLVAYEEPLQQAINSKISGWVETLHVSETGQEVQAGDPLLDIYSPELVAAQEELLLALRNLETMEESEFESAIEDAERLLDATRRRLQLWDIDSAQIERLEESQEVEKTLTLYAPVSGVVSKKQVRAGEYVTAGRELLEISNLSNLWVYADIYEYEIPWVRTGQQAYVKFPFLDTPISGTVSRIYPYLEAKTRTVKARIALENPDLVLKPDMYADVEIRTDPVQQVLSVPMEAVLFSGKHETVFVDLGEGRFEPRPVTIGHQDEEGFVEIISGLEDGERVVTSAQFMLDSESKLREALQKMRKPAEDENDPEDLF